MAIEIDTEQQTTGRELSGEERLYRAFLEFVDPDTFNGADCFACLVGQVQVALGNRSLATEAFVARHFGVDIGVVQGIYNTAEYYGRNLPGALRMAREELGLSDD